MENGNGITRHDIPQTVKDVLNVAVQSRTIDIFDVYEMAITHKDNWANLVNELCEVAFSNIHWNREAHKQVVAAAEAYWMESAEPTLAPVDHTERHQYDYWH